MILILMTVGELLTNLGAGILTTLVLGAGGFMWSMNTKLAVLMQMAIERDKRDELKEKDLERRFSQIHDDLSLLRTDLESLKARSPRS